MLVGTIKFGAKEKTKGEVIDKVLCDMNDEIRRKGVGIKIEELKEPKYEIEKDLYILTIYSGVEPILTGPFLNVEKRQIALTALKKEYGEESSYYPLDISAHADFKIGMFK